MILRQYLHVDPVAASYLFGCGGRSMAAVVDPVGDIGPYLDAAGKTYTPITFRPAARWPKQPMLRYVLFGDSDVAFAFHGVREGDVLELGNVAIRVMHTRGHTPEHISLLVTDRTRSDEPWFV